MDSPAAPGSNDLAASAPAAASVLTATSFVEFQNADEAIGVLNTEPADFIVSGDLESPLGDGLEGLPLMSGHISEAVERAHPVSLAGSLNTGASLSTSLSRAGPRDVSSIDVLASHHAGGSRSRALSKAGNSTDPSAGTAAGSAAAALPLQRVEMLDKPTEFETTLADRLRYWRYYISLAMWLPDYSFRDRFARDLFAGLSVGAMMIPQSMAYTSIINVNPMAGLATALFATAVYFVLGNSRVLTVGPEATTSMMLGNAILSIPEIARARELGLDISAMCLQAAAAITLLTGICTLLFGLLRLGFVDSVFSRPVLSGFVCAVGLLLLVDQTPKMLGLPPCTDCREEYTWTKLRYIVREALVHVHVEWHTAVVAGSCVAFLVATTALKKIFPQNKALPLVPFIFVLVVVATAVSGWAGLADLGVRVIGSKASSFPTPRLPDLNYLGHFSSYLPTAVTLTVLGFVQTHMINKTLPQSGIVSANRELVALGSMMVVTPFFGGYAAYGSITRSRISASAGTTSPFAILIAGIMTLVTMLFLMPSFAQMPIAVPAAIVFFVGVGLIETKELVLTYRMGQWRDFLLNVAMILVTFFFNVKVGLFFAFGVCLLLVIKQQKKPSVRLIGRLQHSVAVAGGAAGTWTTGLTTSSTSQPHTLPSASTTTATTTAGTAVAAAGTGSGSTSQGAYGAFSKTTATGTAMATTPPAAGLAGEPSRFSRQYHKVEFAGDAVSPLLAPRSRRGSGGGILDGSDALSLSGSGVTPSQARSLVHDRRGSVGRSSSSSSDPYYEVQEGANLHAEHLEGILIYQIDGPLFFSNSEGLKDRTRRIEYFGNVVSHPSEPIKPLALKGIIFDLTAVTSVDTSASQVIKEIIMDYNMRGVRVYIVKLRRALFDTFVAAGIVGALGEGRLLGSVDGAVARIQRECNAEALEALKAEVTEADDAV